MQLQPLSPAYSPWSSGAPGGLYGLGAGEGQKIALQTVSSAGAIASGTAPLWTAATWAIPVIGAAVAGVCLALMAIFNRKGPKQKEETTRIVEEVISQLQQNLVAYQAGPHTISSQAQALANFDAGWQFILSNCGLEEMGDPGQRCILERMPRRLCDAAYANPGSIVSWWRPDLNEVLSRDQCGRYEMEGDLRSPIANDPNVRPDPILGDTGEIISGSLEQAASLLPGGGSGLLLIGGATLLLTLGMGGTKS